VTHLRSPFTGEIFTVPPEHATPTFVEALIKAGFTRVDSRLDEKKNPRSRKQD